MNLHTLLAFYPGWEGTTVVDVVANVGVEVVTAVVFFFLGAMLGSFLNVVVYRMPIRKNLIWPPSSCPACGHRLELSDNIPVLSWLWLRGKCRYCQARIPASYLWVEVFLGAGFLALLYLEVHTGGLNLPIRTPNSYGGALYTIWFPRADILSLYFYHCTLMFFLTCFVVLVIRRERLPGSLVLVAILFGILIPLLRPDVQQVPWTGVQDGQHYVSASRTGVVDAVIGLVAGMLLGAALSVFHQPRRCRPASEGAWMALSTSLDLAVVLCLAGAWFGWQAAVSVAMFTAITITTCSPRVPVLIIATMAIAVQLVTWRLLTLYFPWWPGPRTSWLLMAGWVVLAIALQLIRPAFRTNIPTVDCSETTKAGIETPPEAVLTASVAPAKESRAGNESKI